MNSRYRLLRNWENLQRATFDGVGKYDVPQIFPADTDCDLWIGFNFAKTCEDRENHGVHFFVDDYQFNRLWTDPDRYVPMLKQFRAVLTPDFSTYTDFPMALQIYNHYRKHWLGAYWQLNDMTVIPTISWGDEDSYEWCFDGEPRNSTLAISSVGIMNDPEAKRLFVAGFNEMMSRLNPTRIILQGELSEECEVDGTEVVKIESFQERLRNLRKAGG